MVRALKSLAGPQNSLAQVGSVGASAGIRLRPSSYFQTLDPPAGANNFRADLDISSGDFKTGDLLVAIALATAAFDGTTRTEISTAGWTEVKTTSGSITGNARIFMKISDGTETTVRGESLRSGGLFFFAIVGASLPDATDITNANAVSSASSTSLTSVSALSDRTGDANLIFSFARTAIWVPAATDTDFFSLGSVVSQDSASGSTAILHLADFAGSGALAVDGNVSSSDARIFFRFALRET